MATIPAAPPPQGAQPAGAPTLDPTQRKYLQVMVKQCMKLLLREDTAAHLVAKAKATSPARAIAEAVAPVLADSWRMARVAGAKVELLTILAAGVEATGVLATLLEKAGVIEEKDIPAVCADAAKLAVNTHNFAVVKGQQGGAGAPPAQGTATPGMMGAGAPQPTQGA